MAIVILVTLSIGLLLTAAALQPRRARLREIARGLLVSYATLALLLGGLELYLRFAYAASDTPMQWTLAGRNWIDRYMQLNALGYRDRDWPPDVLAARQTILVVGDSFTEGWGVEAAADRYPDVLAARLGAAYAVVNLGKGGTSTLHHIERLRAYPYQTPQVVIWQYLLNDIDVAAQSNGLTWESPLPALPALAEESHLANFLFWRIYRTGMFVSPQGVAQWDWLYSAYDDSAIWAIHQGELERMIDVVEAMGARLIVVIFPNMEDPVRSVPYVDRVAAAIASRGHTDILKLFDQAAAMPLDERLVSRADAHPSAAFHRLVGNLLYERFFAPES